MDKKGAKIACFARKEVIVLIGIKEIYIKVPQNRLFITIIKCIFVNSKAILLLIIILSILIIK